jgi:hypothetical protein
MTQQKRPRKRTYSHLSIAVKQLDKMRKELREREEKRLRDDRELENKVVGRIIKPPSKRMGTSKRRQV